MFIDTHTHLYSEEFGDDKLAMVQRAIDAGVKTLLMPNIDSSSIDEMHRIERLFPNNCYSMIGLHPGNVKANFQEELTIMKSWLDKRDYVAIGEIGMDLYWDKTFIEEQKEAFKIQVEWAKERTLPIVIHAREAFEEIFNLLDEINDERLTGVFHCFTGDEQDVRKIQSYGGFKFGLGGVLTYKKSTLSEVVTLMKLSEIILETDSPYLAPVPKRGKKNESAFLPYIADKLSDVLEVSIEEVARFTSENARDLFKI